MLNAKWVDKMPNDRNVEVGRLWVCVSVRASVHHKSEVYVYVDLYSEFLRKAPQNCTELN